VNQVPPFWLAGLALLVVLAIMSQFPRAGAALLGVLLLVLVLNSPYAKGKVTT
jgi:hypothetical protein